MSHSFANTPRVIAFEGVDGAGKSTVLELVANHLRSLGVSVFLPRIGKEHASKPIREIRNLTRDRTNLDLCPRTELLLYAARETQVLEQLVRPALTEGATVLLDRSMLTPVVLGSHGRGLELSMCESIAREASGGLHPDLTLIFDVEPRTSRIRKRLEKIRTGEFRNSGRKGLAGSGFSERIREGYLSLAARDGLSVFHCERGTPQEIAARVIAKLETGSFEEDAEQARPWWRVEPELDFESALEQLPALMRLYFTRSLPLGRAIRSELFEREGALAIWATDLDDPLLERALERAPERVLARLSRLGASTGGRLGLAGVAALREQLLASHPDVVARSLERITGEDADRMRERLAELAPGAVVESLAGRSDAFALELRERLWKQADIHERADGLQMCEDPDAWRRRERLLEKDPAVVLPSLRGLDPARVDPILARYVERAPKPVLSALLGRADVGAHQLRARLVDTGRELIDSISGLDDPDSWALRERFCERWPSTVATSLLGMPLGDRAHAVIARCREAAPTDLFLKRRLALLDRPFNSEMTRMTDLNRSFLLLLPLALGCNQPPPPGSDDGGSESSSAGDTTTDMSEGETGTDTGMDEETLCPLADGAHWVYVLKSTSGQVLDMDDTMTTETTWNGMQAWYLSDQPNVNGETSVSTLISNGTEVFRVHREESDQVSTTAIIDYDPGFLRCSEAWTTVGPKQEYLYDRTEYDGDHQNPVVEARGHTFEVLAIGEQVTVPAGTFDCVKVERVRTVGAEAGALAWFWFAPGVGKVREERPVEMEIEELVSVSIPGGVNLP